MLPIPVRSRRLALAAIVLAVAAIAPAVASATTPDHRPVVPQLDWIDCGDGLECATASVPLDYDRPHGEHISLSLARLPATDQAHRVGSLFVNNGGPGNSVLEFMRADVTSVVPAEVQARFDIVGFDPRGIGESTPIRCFADADAQQEFFAPLPAFPVTPEEIDQAISAARELGRRCRQRNGSLLDHVSTANVARDLDLLRRAVGDDQLTFAGYSYGGILGMTYAQLFPGKVRATLIDGAPDPVDLTSRTLEARHTPFSARLGGEVAASDALGFFLDSCESAGPDRCAFAAPDTRAKFDELMAALRAGPITVDLPSGPAGPGGPTTVTYAFAVDSLRGALQFPPIWADVAGLLQLTHEAGQANGPDAAVTASDAVDSVGASASDGYDNRNEALLAVVCSETSNPNNPRRWADAAIEADRNAPYFGADFAWLSLPCATWDGRDHDRVGGSFDAETANPMLFLHSQFDAASPLAQADEVAARTPGARLLGVEGAGHPASFIPNRCVTAAVAAYLVDQTLPAAGAVCPAEFQPFS